MTFINKKSKSNLFKLSKDRNDFLFYKFLNEENFSQTFLQQYFKRISYEGILVLGWQFNLVKY
ncbi:unnamed protein product [Paramecium primaurelia]|uniref:Uncharacterized protein n=1 Tax=Paramecium primaurelia TaxID=5886 RepID=A0A8S1NEZ3_PARPR|nr:unnamed protein product [Paramecium primaurelia]